MTTVSVDLATALVWNELALPVEFNNVRRVWPDLATTTVPDDDTAAVPVNDMAEDAVVDDAAILFLGCDSNVLRDDLATLPVDAAGPSLLFFLES